MPAACVKHKPTGIAPKMLHNLSSLVELNYKGLDSSSTSTWPIEVIINTDTDQLHRETPHFPQFFDEMT